MRTAKISSLVYREMLGLRTEILKNGTILMILSVLFLLLMLSMQFGNLALLLEDDTSLRTDLSIYMSYCSVALIGLFAVMLYIADIGCFPADLRANWMRYSYTLPISPAERTLARYLSKSILLVIGLLFGVLYSVLFCRIAGQPFQKSFITLYLLGIDYVMLYDLCVSLFMLRERSVRRAMTASFKGMLLLIFMITITVLILKRTPLLNDFDIMEEGMTIKKAIEKANASHDQAAHILIPVLLLIALAALTGSICITYCFLKQYDNGKLMLRPEEEAADRKTAPDNISLKFFRKKES